VPAHLRPLTDEEISEFIEWQVEQYVEERVRSGETARYCSTDCQRAIEGTVS